ncbi:thiol:disulfide interchange protein DsbA/DsbL [Pistricoccus aurantiacus]|uniref:Thiol:disulfide interchange protein n=1 Tax=Pistricoccus aurantiacus TaxID=1883414 RepID=A0A5B8SQL6_9GAMM|nr:thiol:disulfide interchange protein DsbA/DsbL [Pistricoccus aurantiacus]QEA38514.1 thiol:disulfide interchange protein DsbA/DsbL [Pistricoccus aurantiacus]
MYKSLIALFAGLSLSGLTLAAAPVAGQDYEVLDEPVSTQTGKERIEVTEAFWYGCPHCYNLEPMIESWAEELPEDVTFTRLPATLGGAWNKHAVAFYAAKELGILDQVHEDFFKAIQDEGRKLTEVDDIAAFFSDYGVSEEQAREMLTSFGVKSQVNRAHARIRAYKLMGVPALIVDGRYVITPSKAGSLENMLIIADALVEETREERSQ